MMSKKGRKIQMNYLEATEYLNSFSNLERTPLDRSARAAITLDSVRELARRLGDPQVRFPSIHVAGTKGKGSTCAFAASILRAQGLRVGLYVSPHLEDVRERITIDGTKIPESDFARILSGCVPVLEEMRRPPAGHRRPTYFEIVTHLAFTYFAEQKVDVAAVEVGLGGRLDATNIVAPDVCGIANISFDHTAILGDTLELIAREKAGIFKQGVPVVIAPQVPGAEHALRESASNAGAPLEAVGTEILATEIDSVSAPEWRMPQVQARLPEGVEYSATLGLRGRHQIENWALALRLADIFYRKRFGKKLSQEAVSRGSRDVEWPGRLELVGSNQEMSGPAIFLDGAHNALSVEVVLNELRAHVKRSPLVCLFGCARDKDVAGMLRAMARTDQGVDKVVFTDSGNPRSCTPAELAQAWNKTSGRAADVRDSSADGFALAVELAGANGVVLVLGSLYLVGKIRAITALKLHKQTRRNGD